MLSCYQQALERRPHCLLVFQRSRALLLRLLANTMPCELSADGADADTLVQLQLGTHTLCLSADFTAPFHHPVGRRQVKFYPSLYNVPSVQSLDLYEDFSKLSAVCKLPVSPDNKTTVIDAFSATISKRFYKYSLYYCLQYLIMSHFLPTPSEYLGDSGQNVLRVVALHEMGNLQFYNDNRRSVFGGAEAPAAFCTFTQQLHAFPVFSRFRSSACVCVCVCFQGSTFVLE